MALCSAIASAISRWVSIVSVLRILPVVSTKRNRTVDYRD